ncbi:hypothetical protein AB0B89_00525 [Sphaerisporangium sp. NPDC049002]|uniref:hypothetical protein n=1 Tax=Sphaerisporangium sp. NPDC049002 TaxID=3155392 RepID=UPI00340ABE85
MTRDWDPDTPGKPVNAAEMEIYVLKSQARRRIATKAAVAGVISAGVIFGAMPALGALVGPSPVSYTCNDGTAPYNFNLTLTGPVATPSPNQAVTVTWVISQVIATPAVTASASVPLASYIYVEGNLVASGTPVAVAPITLKPIASQVPLTTLEGGDPLPIPTMTATVTPTATGSFTVKPDQFIIRVGSSTAPAAYTCTIAPSASPSTATPPALAVAVASPSVSATDMDTSTPTPTPTLTPTTSKTPKPTHTVYETVTNKPSQQVTKKPGGGAATGGGGDAGPDGRTFVLVGTVLVFGAGVGGLMMRRRRPNRG